MIYSISYVTSIYKNLIVALVISFVLSGCAAQPHLTDTKAPVPGQTLVIGSVEVIEDGKPMKWGMTWTGDRQCRLLILPPDSSQPVLYQLSEDGHFSWGLMPGEYTIAGYDLSIGTRSRSGRIWARFTVAPGVKNLYVGHLKLLMAKGAYAVGIKDDYDAAIEGFRKRFPKALDLPNKRLMVPEPRLSAFERKRHVCAEGWGIQCDKTYRGVTPHQPAGTTESFGTVDSLTPSFEWRGSSNEDTAYDLVIYEALAYSRSGMDTQYMPGRIAAYAEALEEPTWRPQTPLKPNQKYFWSVRLRRDGVVSNWSKYSYFAFYIFGWSSGYGQWFSFSTPAK